MSITEYQRHQLFTWFEEHMGKERATTMMNLVPPVGWGDVATTRDLELHRVEKKHDLLELRTAVGAALSATRHERVRRSLQPAMSCTTRSGDRRRDLGDGSSPPSHFRRLVVRQPSGRDRCDGRAARHPLRTPAPHTASTGESRGRTRSNCP